MAEARLANVVIDCADVGRLAQFWMTATGYQFCIVRAVPAPDAENP